jgi:anti-sigma factor ChrR (cupin superfamily)
MSKSAILRPEVIEGLVQRAQEIKDGPGWQPFHPGVEAQYLYDLGPGGPAAVLLRYEPGAHIPLHEHIGYEHVLVLEGEQSDAEGVYSAGTLVVNPPGTSHWLDSKTGCLALLIYEKPVRFLPENAISAEDL